MAGRQFDFKIEPPACHQETGKSKLPRPAHQLGSKISAVQQKSQIRREKLSLLKGLAPAKREAASTSMFRLLQESDLWESTRSILIYHPLKSEPDTSQILTSTGRTIFLPRVTASGLDIHLYSGPSSLTRSPHGMLEPDPTCSPIVSPEEIGLAIIPGLAFDPLTGVRLGRGGGYYDRLLADERYRAHTLGIAFELQIESDLPLEPHDQTIDYLLTESGLRTISSPSG